MKRHLASLARLVMFLLGTWLVTLAILSTTRSINLNIYKEEAHAAVAFRDRPSDEQVSKLRRDLDCLARNIYWEARSESYDGKVAVAQVTLNRVMHKRFPNDVCEVVYQGPTRPSWKDKTVRHPVRHRCQFSWYCDGKSDNIPTVNISIFRECYDIAKKVLIDGVRLPKIKNAIYYHADYVNPGWPNPKIAKIGKHIFYSE